MLELRRFQALHNVPHLNELSSEESDPSTARALAEPLEPVSSITEHTTRALEPSYDKREPETKH